MHHIESHHIIMKFNMALDRNIIAKFSFSWQFMILLKPWIKQLRICVFVYNILQSASRNIYPWITSLWYQNKCGELALIISLR